MTAVSPIDGRYRGKTQELANYFSEFALIRYRVRVEIEYFTALCEFQLPQLAGVSRASLDGLREIWQNFSEQDAAHIKEIEKVTNHDVKAVEYFIKEKFDLADNEASTQPWRTTKELGFILSRNDLPSVSGVSSKMSGSNNLKVAFNAVVAST